MGVGADGVWRCWNEKKMLYLIRMVWVKFVTRFGISLCLLPMGVYQNDLRVRARC